MQVSFNETEFYVVRQALLEYLNRRNIYMSDSPEVQAEALERYLAERYEGHTAKFIDATRTRLQGNIKAAQHFFAELMLTFDSSKWRAED